MGAAGKYALVIGGALGVGVSLVILSFVGLDFIWTHLVVTDPQRTGLGDGVVVVGGGFLIGCSLGLAGVIFILWRFWPGRAPEQSERRTSEKA